MWICDKSNKCFGKVSKHFESSVINTLNIETNYINFKTHIKI